MNMKKHIIIAGKRHVGKSTLINRLLELTDKPVYGFRTAPGRSMKKGCRSFFIFPAGEPEMLQNENCQTEENHIGDGNGITRQGYPEAFNNYGVRCLEAEPDGIVVMDELGFMEKDADAFCSRILELLDGDIPVIASAKAGHDHEIEFLSRVLNHPNADVYYITPENRDALYDELKERFGESH